MPLPWDIYTVDTLQSRSVEEALLSGSLSMPDTDPLLSPATLGWGDYMVNWIPAVLSALVLILFVGRIVELMPFLLGGVRRWKVIINLEDSVGRTRDRNRVLAASLLPLCLILSRFSIFVPHLAHGKEAPIQSIAIVAALFLAFILREILYVVISPFVPKLKDEYADISHRGLYNFLILLTISLIIICAALVLAGVNELIIRNIIIGLSLFFIFVFLVRRYQILCNCCNDIKAFLYLCALEIPSLGLLALSMIFP